MVPFQPRMTVAVVELMDCTAMASLSTNSRIKEAPDGAPISEVERGCEELTMPVAEATRTLVCEVVTATERVVVVIAVWPKLVATRVANRQKSARKRGKLRVELVMVVVVSLCQLRISAG